jgi:hypothetical protein
MLSFSNRKMMKRSNTPRYQKAGAKNKQTFMWDISRSPSAAPFLQRAGGGMPLSLHTKLRYHESFSLNPGAGTFAAAFYRANGLFDPTVAVGGHQPSGFDQLMQFYNHFTVVGADATLNACVTGGTNIQNLFGIKIQPTAAIAAGSTDALLETDQCIWRLNGYPGAPTEPVRVKLDISKYFRRTPEEMINTEPYRGDAATDPVEQVYFACFLAAAAAADDPASTTMRIDILYDVVFSEPKELAQS